MPVTMNGFSNPAFRREHNNAPEGHNQTTSIAGGRDFEVFKCITILWFGDSDSDSYSHHHEQDAEEDIEVDLDENTPG